MSPKSKNTSGKFRVLVALLFAFAIYLLCTSYLYITYRGAFISVSDSSMYKVGENSVSFSTVKIPEEEALAGLLLSAKADTDNLNISLDVQTDADTQGDIFLSATVNRGENGIFDVTANGLKFDTGELKKGDEVTVIIKDSSNDEYYFDASINFDESLLAPSYVYDTSQASVVSYSAFDLLFGSQSRDNMNFKGNLFALFFWLPPLIGTLAFIFDRRTSAKFLIGMASCVIGIFAVIYFIGGERLAFGSMLSIVLYLLIFVLCVYGLLSSNKETTPTLKD